MSVLLGRQVLFLRLLARLVLWAESQGYALTMGEGYVGDTDARDGDYDGPHKRNGLHYRRLAIDLNLFLDGVYQAGACPEWEAIGQHWTSLDPLCAWGGSFAARDYNHFSIRHEGLA